MHASAPLQPQTCRKAKWRNVLPHLFKLGVVFRLSLVINACPLQLHVELSHAPRASCYKLGLEKACFTDVWPEGGTLLIAVLRSP